MSAQRKPNPEKVADIDDLMSALEKTIDNLMTGRRLPPLTQLATEGHSFEYAEVRMPVGDVKAAPATRNIAASPLEYLYHSARSKIEMYQYIAGCRFRLDWHMANAQPSSTVDYTRAAIFLTDEMMKQTSKGYIAGLDGPALAGALRAGAQGISDKKIDAMRRLGQLSEDVGSMDYWLADKFIGQEWRMGQLAKVLEIDDRAAAVVIRLMLDKLAGHYRLRS